MSGVSRSSSGSHHHSVDNSNKSDNNDEKQKEIEKLLKELQDGSISAEDKKKLEKLTGMSEDELNQMADESGKV